MTQIKKLDTIYNLVKSANYHQIIVKKEGWKYTTAKVYRINFKYRPIEIGAYINDVYKKIPNTPDYEIIKILNDKIVSINKKDY